MPHVSIKQLMLKDESKGTCLMLNETVQFGCAPDLSVDPSN